MRSNVLILGKLIIAFFEKIIQKKYDQDYRKKTKLEDLNELSKYRRNLIVDVK